MVPQRRPRHPRKEIEDAIAEAEAAGWQVRQTASGHRWGVMLCGESSRTGCRYTISSTPRNADNHAK